MKQVETTRKPVETVEPTRKTSRNKTRQIERRKQVAGSSNGRLNSQSSGAIFQILLVNLFYKKLLIRMCYSVCQKDLETQL